MRHRVAGRRLGRTREHRLALRRNLAASLFEHETISTTMEKAKEVKPFVERLITLARKGDLPSRRRAIALLGNRDIVAIEDGQPVKKGTVVGRLFSEIAPRFLERPGGYTRIIRLSLRRLGDNGELVLLQLLGEDEPLKKERKAGKKKRGRVKDVVPPGIPEKDESKQETAVTTVQAEEDAVEEVESAASPEGSHGSGDDTSGDRDVDEKGELSPERNEKE